MQELLLGTEMKALAGNGVEVVPSGKSQAAFAREIGWTRARLNELIKGKRGVTADAALDLADALGTSARLWMNLQVTYDLDEASRKRQAA